MPRSSSDCPRANPDCPSCASLTEQLTTERATRQQREKELALYKEQAQKWNAEADAYLRRSDELTVALSALRGVVQQLREAAQQKAAATP